MPRTRTKKASPVEKAPLSEAEKHQRQMLKRNHGIDPEDDRAVHDWIKSLVTPLNDARSLWEKRVQARLARELGIAS